jgi:creatinine amidohydrolase
MVEARLKTDDRCVLPLGCTEQHAFLSLSTDSILAERVAVDAALPLGVPVFPVVAYGMTPAFTAYPGTVSLKMSTYAALLVDILEGLGAQGFGRIAIVNGHGGNTPARTAVQELASKPGAAKLVWHDWWSAPLVMAKVKATDPDASHASWMENFPWTRLHGVEQPQVKKPMVDWEQLRTSPPERVREALGDGSFGGLYQRDDDEMQAIWDVAVAETRAVIASLS